MALQNFLIASFVTLSPILILKYKGGLNNKNNLLSFIIAYFWMFFAIVLSTILVNAMNYRRVWHVLIPTVLIESIYNFFIIRGDVDLKKLPKSFFVFCLFFFSSLFELIPIKLFHLSFETMNQTTASLLTLFSDGVALFILVLVYFKDLKEDLKKLKKNFYGIMDTAIKYWFIGIAVMVISNLMIQWFAPQSVAGNEQAVQQLLNETPWLTFIAASFLAPFIEELTFRKAFKDVFKNNILFCLTSGLVFGGLHVIFTMTSPWDLLYIIPYGSLGVAFAYTLVKTDNVYASIIMHLLHNTALTSLSLLGMVIL